MVLVYLNNSSFLAKPRDGRPFLLAHRGLAQTFSMEGITGETNTARRIYEPEHPYLENTIPSMEAAFRAGADMVELDIHPTKDGQFAVFHDWTLDYRTNGTGTIREHTMAELKKLDIGYGYTADDGKTFPFCGRGIGLMPSLDEVLEGFPNHSLLIHVKSNDPQEGILLAQYLQKLPAGRLPRLMVYGGSTDCRSKTRTSQAPGDVQGHHEASFACVYGRGLDGLYAGFNEKCFFLFTTKIRPLPLGLATPFHKANQRS